MPKTGVMLGADAPGVNAVAVTPDDDVDINARALWVGSTGDLEVVMAGERDPDNTVVFSNVPGGTWMPISVRRVMEATTAEDIVAIF